MFGVGARYKNKVMRAVRMSYCIRDQIMRDMQSGNKITEDQNAVAKRGKTCRLILGSIVSTLVPELGLLQKQNTEKLDGHNPSQFQ